MAKLQFTSNSAPTVGVELELGIVDAESFQLVSGADRLRAGVPGSLDATVKPELMQCCIEVISGVCQDVSEARD